jgi:hypothetical protein
MTLPQLPNRSMFHFFKSLAVETLGKLGANPRRGRETHHPFATKKPGAFHAPDTTINHQSSIPLHSTGERRQWLTTGSSRST